MIATSSAIPISSGVREIETWSPMSADLASEFEYIDIAAIDREQKVITATARTRASDAPSRARQIVQKGDVLVSTVRPALNAVAVVPPSLDGAIASTGFTVLRSDERRLHGPYLFHWVRGTAFIDEMVRLATGASYPAVSDRIVKASSIPIPFPDDPRRSLAEQKRIAAILDKADAIRRRRQEAARLADTLIPSVFHEMFGDPVSNPKAWPRKPLGELLDAIESGWSPVCADRAAGPDEWGVLKLGGVTWCSYDDTENKALLPGVEPEKNLEIRSGDLLMSRKNTYALLAASAFVFETRPRILLPDLVYRLVLKPDAGLESEYLWQQLLHPGRRSEIQRLAGGSAGSMPNISKEKLRTVLVEVPPRTLQQRFKALTWAHRKIAAQYGAALKREETLFDALVQLAFRGEL